MPESRGAKLVRWGGLVAGPVVALLVYWLLPEQAAGSAGGLSDSGRATAAVGAWMAIWWLSEAIPLSATALLPIAAFPLLGIMPVGEVTARYGHELIFLFLGGFVLGLGMQRWGLHKRIALVTILMVGTRPRSLIAGFMLATAVLSMFVSNTATAIMLLPIAVSVVDLVAERMQEQNGSGGDRDPRIAAFATCLLLSIAYAASIGGLGTLIGTPPNTLLAAFARQEFGVEITFAGWMKLGIPLVAVFLPLAWLYLTRIAFRIRVAEIPGGRELIRGELAALGRMSRGEWTVFTVFSCTAALWIFRTPIADLLGLYTGEGRGREYLLTDTGIAIAAALALFIIPVDLKSRTFAMDWEQAVKLPWGILLLFGGGLALAAGLSSTGVDAFIGSRFEALAGLPTFALVMLIAATVLFLTELTSNTAVTNALLPVLAAAAVAIGVAPRELLVPAALAASCAFMLPVATPPNAIVFASGMITIRQMALVGLWLNLMGIAIITLATVLLGDVVFPVFQAE